MIIALCTICGVLVFSHFADCDPLHAGFISKRDQLFVYYVVDVIADDLPGMPGLFVASLFSAALSTFSSGINGLAAVTCRDFGINSWLKSKQLSETGITWASKIISALYGGVAILLIFPIQQLPGILDAALALYGAIGGPLLGTFICGIFIPMVNHKGALVGLIISLAITIWIAIGEKTDGLVASAQRLPSCSTLACDWDMVKPHAGPSFFTQYNQIPPEAHFVPERPLDFTRLEGIQNLYSISYLYLGVVGVFVNLFISLVVSAFTGFDKIENYEGTQVFHKVVYYFSSRKSQSSTCSSSSDREHSSSSVTTPSCESSIKESSW